MRPALHRRLSRRVVDYRYDHDLYGLCTVRPSWDLELAGVWSGFAVVAFLRDWV
jgi:hypothetical protein